MRSTVGRVLSASRQWWLTVNTKAVRRFSGDGAIYPYIIRVEYEVDGRKYAKRKWIGAGKPVPSVGAEVRVMYDENRPSKAKVL